MKDSIEHGPVFCMKQWTLEEAEEYFGKPHDICEDLESRTSMYNFKGEVIGYITIHEGNDIEGFV